MRFYAYFLSAKRFQCCCERENCAENWLAVRDGNPGNAHFTPLFAVFSRFATRTILREK